MDVISVLVELAAKVAIFSVEAREASKAGDVERHARAIKAQEEAKAEAKKQLGALAVSHEAVMVTAAKVVDTRFPTEPAEG